MSAYTEVEIESTPKFKIIIFLPRWVVYTKYDQGRIRALIGGGGGGIHYFRVLHD